MRKNKIDRVVLQMDLSDAVLKEFANFWREGYVLSNRQTGCAIMCMSTKLELLDAEYNLHHGNALEFAKKHGAGNFVNFNIFYN